MADLISVRPEDLRAKAATYSQSSEQVDQVLNTLTTATNALVQDEWKGAASEKFAAQFEELKPYLTKFIELTKDVSEQLNKSAEIIEENDQRLGAQFGMN